MSDKYTQVKLRNCPFCGWSVRLAASDIGKYRYQIRCEVDSCPAKPSVEGNTEYGVIAGWNLRHGGSNADTAS